MATPISTELVEAARDGGATEIERLLKEIWPNAYRVARAILGEPQGAEDAAQEACIILYRTIASLRNAAEFRVWFYRIVVREASELKRRRSRFEHLTETAPHRSDQTAAIDVWRALSALPQNLRDVVVLRYFEGLSSREIANVLRTSDGAVRFRLMIARRRLRPLLDDDADQITRGNNEVRVNAV